MSGRECGVFKAMMLLSLPPHGRCKQWEQTGIQTLGKDTQRLRLTPRGSKRMSILPRVQCYLDSTPFPDKEPEEGMPCLGAGQKRGPSRGGYRMLTLSKVGTGPGGSAAKPAGRCPVAHHILLWLEKDDVQLGCKEAAEHHRATEADRHTHRSGLHL